MKSTETDLHTIDDLDHFITTAQGYSKIETMKYLGGDMEDFRLYGWAYAEGNENNLPNHGKTVHVILHDQKGRTYQANASVTIRPDIFYSETDIGRKPISGNTGFEAVFSTLLLPNGAYDVYIYVQENEEVMAMLNTGLTIAKTHADIHDNSMVCIEPVKNTKDSDEIVFTLDNLHYNEDGTAFIKGWGIHQEIASDDAKMLLQITDHKNKTCMYQLKSVAREDIQSAFGEQYLNSGFAQNILLPDSFTPGEVIVRFIVKNNDAAYISSKELIMELIP